jgi:hypothetical protein
MVRGLSKRLTFPTEGPAATWDFRKSIKEEEDYIFYIIDQGLS